jgi:hypothetical protein
VIVALPRLAGSELALRFRLTLAVAASVSLLAGLTLIRFVTLGLCFLHFAGGAESVFT